MTKSSPEQCIRWMSVDICDAIMDVPWVIIRAEFPIFPVTFPIDNNIMRFIINFGTHLTDVEYNTTFVEWCKRFDLYDSYLSHSVTTSPYNYVDDSSDKLLYHLIRESMPIYKWLYHLLCNDPYQMCIRLYRAKLITTPDLIPYGIRSPDDIRSMMIDQIRVSNTRFVRALCDIAIELQSIDLLNLMFNSEYTRAFKGAMTDDHVRYVQQR